MSEFTLIITNKRRLNRATETLSTDKLEHVINALNKIIVDRKYKIAQKVADATERQKLIEIAVVNGHAVVNGQAS